MAGSPRRPTPLIQIFSCAAFLSIAVGTPAAAQQSLSGTDLNAVASGVLGVLGLSIVPSETASAVSLDSQKANGGANLFATQLGGAFTYSDEFPIYLEGFAEYARYDPKYVFSAGAQERSVEAKWNNFAATVGVGWDLPLTDELALRPIANGSLGHVQSDASIATNLLSEELGEKLDFLRGGTMNAYGLGGALMLDYNRMQEAYETDVELRYTHIQLSNFGDTSSAVRGSADAQTLGLWSRLRLPTGYEALNRPLRSVGEFSASYLIGDQRFALGTDYLFQVGAGIELDVSESSPLYLQRTRLMARYLFGKDIDGFSIGIGLSW